MGESDPRIATFSTGKRVRFKSILKDHARRIKSLSGVLLPITGSAVPPPPKSQPRSIIRAGRPDASVEKRRKVMRKVPKNLSLEKFCIELDRVRLAIPDWPGHPRSWHEAFENKLLRPNIKSMRAAAYATAR
jgi:hypothetical protein